MHILYGSAQREPCNTYSLVGSHGLKTEPIFHQLWWTKYLGMILPSLVRQNSYLLQWEFCVDKDWKITIYVLPGGGVGEKELFNS